MSKNGTVVIGITGASGAIYGIRALELLKRENFETHLIISKAASITISQETGYKISDVQKLADHYHKSDNIAAIISSGSFKTKGMIIAPCSVKTAAEIASGLTTSLISRAADVTLKERRKLILMIRETPLHLGHLRNFVSLAEMGAIIAPPLPAFYPNPKSVDDIVNYSVGRALDLLDIEIKSLKRWQGIDT